MGQSTTVQYQKMSLLSLPLFANHVLVRHEELNVNRKARPESAGQKHYLDAFLVDTLTDSLWSGKLALCFTATTLKLYAS